MNNLHITTGYIGEFKGWRLNGKSYDPEGNEVPEIHEADCFCCGDLLTPKDK